MDADLLLAAKAQGLCADLCEAVQNNLSNLLGRMAANVLNSKRAVAASVQVVRAFVRLRQMLASSTELARKLAELEKKYDVQFKVVFDAIRQLMTPPEPKRKQIGFHAKSLKR